MWLVFLAVAARSTHVWAPLEPKRRDGVILGEEAVLMAESKGDSLCVAMNGGEMSCVCGNTSEGHLMATLSGLRPGTHVIRSRVDDLLESEEIIDVLPKSPPTFWSSNLSAETAVSTRAALAERRTVCVLTNSLEEHSQNRIFAMVSAGLDPTQWSTQWFAPARERQLVEQGLETNSIVETLWSAMVPIHAVAGLESLDWREARRGRLLDGSTSVALSWAERRASAAAALARCDIHWYANTYDDDAVAGMAEVAVALAPRAKRIMELPNLYPPEDAPIDAFVAPSNFAASSVRNTSYKPCTVIHPAISIVDDGSPRPQQQRRLVVAYLGRLAPERSPGLFIRVVAELRRRRVFRVEPNFPGEPANEKLALVALMAGDGPLRNAMIRLSDQTGAAVRVLGSVPRHRVVRFLKGVHVLLQPRPHGETFGLANAEAAALGTLVIAYARSGAVESAGPGAKLVDSLDFKAYADAVQAITTTDLLRADNVSARVQVTFCPTRAIEKYHSFFAELLFSDPVLADTRSKRTLVSSSFPPMLMGGAPPLSLTFSPTAAYAAPLVTRALTEIWPFVGLVISAEKSPDVAFVGCIEGGCADKWTEACGQVARHTVNQAAIAVLICGEPWPTDPFYKAGYFDIIVSTLTTADVYLPVAATALGEIQPDDHIAVIERLRHSRAVNISKHYQVAYLYYRCRPHRERFIADLRALRVQVEALGACNGSGEPKSSFSASRFARDWHNEAIDMYRPFRFVVAFENSEAPGYVTEKLVLALLAGAVPLYWGNSTAASDIFNPRAFVDCTRLADACAQRVKFLVENASAYNEIRNAPPLNPSSNSSYKYLAATNLASELARHLAPVLSAKTAARSHRSKATMESPQ